MISSSRVVKAHQQSVGRQRVSVEASLPEPPPAALEPEITEAFSEVVERAKKEARAIIEQAEIEAEKARQKAHHEGYERGYEEGLRQGQADARETWDEVRHQLEEPLALIGQAKEYLGRLNDESTLALAAALTMSVYSRLKLERLDVLAAYIAELASTVDKERVTLFLDPTWGPRLRALEEVLTEAVPGVACAVDESLAQGAMRVEADGAGALGGPLLSLRALLEEVLG